MTPMISSIIEWEFFFQGKKVAPPHLFFGDFRTCWLPLEGRVVLRVAGGQRALWGRRFRGGGVRRSDGDGGGFLAFRLLLLLRHQHYLRGLAREFARVLQPLVLVGQPVGRMTEEAVGRRRTLRGAPCAGHVRLFNTQQFWRFRRRHAFNWRRATRERQSETEGNEVIPQNWRSHRWRDVTALRRETLSLVKPWPESKFKFLN